MIILIGTPWLEVSSYTINKQIMMWLLTFAQKKRKILFFFSEKSLEIC